MMPCTVGGTSTGSASSRQTSPSRRSRPWSRSMRMYSSAKSGFPRPARAAPAASALAAQPARGARRSASGVVAGERRERERHGVRLPAAPSRAAASTARGARCRRRAAARPSRGRPGRRRSRAARRRPSAGPRRRARSAAARRAPRGSDARPRTPRPSFEPMPRRRGRRAAADAPRPSRLVPVGNDRGHRLRQLLLRAAASSLSRMPACALAISPSAQ